MSNYNQALNIALCAIHGVVVASLIGIGFRRFLNMGWAHAICAGFIVLWTDLVLTGLVLGMIGQLGNRAAYVGVSILIAAAFLLVARRISPPLGKRVVEDIASSWRERLVSFAIWLCILAVALPSILICWSYQPDNFDSLAYRFPRVFFYLGQGSLRHISIGDFRLNFYPFDLPLLYMGLAINDVAGTAFNFVGLLVWAIGGVAVYRFAMDLGARKVAGLFAAALFLTAPAVLISAASTNDDMIAGVPLLIGAMLLWRWWRSRQVIDLLIGTAGVGLSAGAKLHFPLFILFFAALVVMKVLVPLIRRGQFFAFVREQIAGLLSAGALFGVLTLPSFIINFVETRRLTPELPNYENLPFSGLIAAVNVAISSLKLMFAAVPDLYLNPNAAARKVVYDSFNNWFNTHLLFWLSPSLNYSNEPYYYFDGVAASDAYWGLWEQSAWLGFIPWLFLLIIIFGIWRKGSDFKVAAVWLAVAFFVWHLTRCLLFKYVGAAGIYYAFPIALTAPALALAVSANVWPLWQSVLLRLFGVFVLATNLVAAANAFAFNPQRNLIEAWNEHFRPRSGLISPEVTAYLRASKRTFIVYSQWELPFFQLMSVEPDARYFVGPFWPGTRYDTTPHRDYDLTLVLDRVQAEYGEVPIRFRNDDRQRLSFLGTMQTTYGPQRAFGHATSPTVPRDSAGDALVFDYDAAHDGNGDAFLAGWSPSERTHRWSNAKTSIIQFYMPPKSEGCALKAALITAGGQKVTTSLNGATVASSDLQGWFPGIPLQLPLPDKALKAGALNQITFHFDHPLTVSGRDLAIGVVRMTVTCHSYDAGAALAARSNYALVQLEKRKGGAGQLIAVKFGTDFGLFPDENFDHAFDLLRPDGSVVSLQTYGTETPSGWLEIPANATAQDVLRIRLRRKDNPAIEGEGRLPLKSDAMVGME